MQDTGVSEEHLAQLDAANMLVPVNQTPVINPSARPGTPPSPQQQPMNFSGTLPQNLQYTPDIERTQYGSQTPVFRLMPVGASGNPTIVAAAQSTAQKVIDSSSFGKAGALNMPTDTFTVAGDKPITNNGSPINVSFVVQDESLFLAGPPAPGAGSQPPVIDSVTTATAPLAVDLTAGPLTPEGDDYCLFFTSGLYASSYIVGTTPAGWTHFYNPSPSVLNGYSIQTSGAVNPTTSASPYWNPAVGVLTLLKVSGTPAIVQSADFGYGASGSQTLAIPSNVTPGNTLIVAFGGNFSTTPVFTVSDTAGDSFYKIGQVGAVNVSEQAVAVFICGTAVGGATTINFSASNVNSYNIYVAEISDLNNVVAPAIPDWRAITISDLPFTGVPSSANYARGDGTWSSPVTALTAGTGISVSGSDGPVTVSLSTPVTVANGGTGTATPGLVQGTNVTISGTWPDQTVSASLPVTSVALTAQAASISATDLIASPGATDIYQISYYLNETTAGASGTVTVTFSWNDGAAQSVTSATVTFGSLGQYAADVLVVKATSGAIQYSTTVTSPVGSPAYSLDIRALLLG